MSRAAAPFLLTCLALLGAAPLSVHAVDPVPILVPDFLVDPTPEIREVGPIAGTWLRNALRERAGNVRVVPNEDWLPRTRGATVRITDPLAPGAAEALYAVSGAHRVAQGYVRRREDGYTVEVRLIALPSGEVLHSGTARADSPRDVQPAVRRAAALVFDLSDNRAPRQQRSAPLVRPLPHFGPRPPAPTTPTPPAAPARELPRRALAHRESFARPDAPAVPTAPAAPVVEPPPAPGSIPAAPDPAAELTEDTIAQVLTSRFPDMAYIPSGPFTMGTDSRVGMYEVDANPWRRLPRGTRAAMLELEGPAHSVTLPGYLIDRNEITNAQFRAFRRTQRFPIGFDNHPIVNVSWQDAMAYARSVGKRLPTEAEWEKAARGADGRQWPWGDEFDPRRVAMDDGPVPVGIYPRGASPYGVLNMAGNVQEWTASVFLPYPGNRTVKAPLGETYRVVRGSHWAGNGFLARTTARFRAAPGRGGARPDGESYQYIGFRCARDAPSRDTLRRWQEEDRATLAAR